MTLDTEMWCTLAERLNKFHQENKPNNKWWKIESWSASTPFHFDYTNYNSGNYDSMWQMNIDLHDAMGEYWLQIKHDPQKVFQYAIWIVEEWGAINSNDASTIQSYCSRILRFEPLDGQRGVASYSKILSAINRRRYFILDARVAFSLNVLQLEFPDSLRQYFDVAAGLNKSIEIFNKEFPYGKFNNVGYQRNNNAVYSIYNNVVSLMAKHLGVSGIEVEMMLFSNADLLVPPAQDAAALFACNIDYHMKKREKMIREANERLRGLGII